MDPETANLIEWAGDAAHVLRQYREYAEGMRTIGRGYYPTGNMGHTPEGVESGLRKAIEALAAAQENRTR